MSGHSKWHKIQHAKGKTDKARSSIFTKLLRSISVTAEQGTDPDMNFALRLAVEKAKAANVPKDNITRAILRGSGQDKDASIFESILYEGFGPGGVAILVDAFTDNKNRAIAEVKLAFSKHGGSVGGPGSVQWQFSHLGVVRFFTPVTAVANWDEIELALIDAGVLDIRADEDGGELLCPIDKLQAVLHAVTSAGLTPDQYGLEWVAKETVSISPEIQEQLDVLRNALEELDDVRDMYTNAE